MTIRYGGLGEEIGEAIPQAVRDAGLEVVRARATQQSKTVEIFVASGEQAELDAAKLDAQAVAPDDWTVTVSIWS